MLASVLSLFSGCATSYRGKIYEAMALGGVAGGLYGHSKPESKDANALLWASAGAAVGAALSVYFLDPEEANEALKTENARLREDLNRIENKRVTAETTGIFGAKIPAKYRHLINPGEWKVTQIDLWVEDGENRLIHQDQVMELIPPSLSGH